jgi:hypothetical protein
VLIQVVETAEAALPLASLPLAVAVGDGTTPILADRVVRAVAAAAARVIPFPMGLPVVLVQQDKDLPVALGDCVLVDFTEAAAGAAVQEQQQLISMVSWVAKVEMALLPRSRESNGFMVVGVVVIALDKIQRALRPEAWEAVVVGEGIMLPENPPLMDKPIQEVEEVVHGVVLDRKLEQGVRVFWYSVTCTIPMPFLQLPQLPTTTCSKPPLPAGLPSLPI